MKKLFIITIIFAHTLIFVSLSYAKMDSCFVTKIIGISIDPGHYKLNVKREDDNLYEIIDEDVYIKTRDCYHFSINSTFNVILVIDPHDSFGRYGGIIGEIYFKD